jgi:hypothetical protein
VARVLLFPDAITRAGTLQATEAYGHPEGNKLYNDGRVYLEVTNLHPSLARDLTVQAAPTPEGLAVGPLVRSIPAASTRLLGPFPPSIYNRGNTGAEADRATAYLDYPAGAEQDVIVRAYHLPGRDGAFPQSYEYHRRVLSTGRANLIFYAPLWEPSGSVITDLAAGRHGVTGGATPPAFGSAGIGDGRTALSFPGATAFGNIYSAGLAGAFNGAEGTLLAWAKVSGAGVWTDGTQRTLVHLGADANNEIWIYKPTLNNQVILRLRRGGGVASAVTYSGQADVGWVCWVITWDANLTTYKNGVVAAPVANGDVWAGALAATLNVLGAYTTAAGTPYSGVIAHVAVFDRALAATEIAALGTL